MSDPTLLQRLHELERRIGQVEVKEKPGAYGTWTPALAGVTTPGTFTYTTQAGNYTRLGNRLFFNGRIITSAITVAPVGLMTITGLPIVAEATGAGGAMGVCNFVFLTGFNVAAGYTQLAGLIVTAESRIQIYKSGDAVATVGVTGAETPGIPAGTIDLIFSGHYQIEEA